MADRNIDDLDPRLRQLALAFQSACATDPTFVAAGAKIGFDQTYRSCADQDAAFAQGRTVPGPISTNARGGQSPHNCVLPDGTPAARAFDFYIQLPGAKLDWNATDPLWQRAIAIGEQLGLVNGSEWHTAKDLGDCDHFEMPNWQQNGIGQVGPDNAD